MLTRDLFAVANLLVIICGINVPKKCRLLIRYFTVVFSIYLFNYFRF